MLHELSAGMPCVYPACAFEVPLLAEMVRGGLFVPGFSPDSGDHIGLEVDGEMREFCVYRVRGEFHCEEVGVVKPRKLRYSEEELVLHTLNREALYSIMADDFGIPGPVAELGRGVWELGRKNFPGQGRAKIIFIEQGVSENDLVACLAQHGFKTNCLLFRGNQLRQIQIPDKTVIHSQVAFQAGQFVTDAFEDVVASRGHSLPVTGIDLDSSPPRLVICGEDFVLPVVHGKPLIGLRYLSILFDRSRDPIPVWDLVMAVNPPPAPDGSNEEEEDESVDPEQIMTGSKRGDHRSKLRPQWNDEEMNAHSKKIARQELAKKQAALESLAAKGEKTGSAFNRLEKEISEIQSYLGGSQRLGRKNKAIKPGDRERARDSVRNGINKVIQVVESQNSERAKELRNSIHFGYDVMFNPPPDWGI
jgi:hypothetical protein